MNLKIMEKIISSSFCKIDFSKEYQSEYIENLTQNRLPISEKKLYSYPIR